MTETHDDRYRAHAAYYGLYLRQVKGLAADEAAALVVDRYPLVHAQLKHLMNGKQGAGQSSVDKRAPGAKHES